LPNVFVSKALRFHADSVLFIKNKFNNKIFYCFDDNPIFDTPKKQFNNNHPFDVRIIHPNHFRTVDLKWLRKYLTGPVTQSTHPHLNEALQGILPEQATTSMPAPAPSQRAEASLVTPAHNVTAETHKNHIQKGNISFLPCNNNIGLEISSTEKRLKLAELYHKHGKSCSNSKLEVVTRYKCGYELFEKHCCKWCSYSFDFSTGPDASDVDPNNTYKKSQGRPARPINTIMTQASFKAGVTPTQTIEMLGEAGVVHPSSRGSEFMQKRINRNPASG
jgi:hypothetical protein